MPGAQATLVYVNDHMQGWRRVRRGRGFSYLAEDGRRISDPEQLVRIRRLTIPAAYTDVWICPCAQGHLQATGRDAKGRKQYRYHPLWKAQRQQVKFERMQDFGRKLPLIRRQVALALQHRKPDFDAVVAAVVRLLDRTALRIGSDEYLDRNGSYGLTTLRDRHAQTQASHIRLQFKGKSAVLQQVALSDRQVARIVRRCQELPGQRLFQFIDGEAMVHQVRSDHVNAYIRAICGQSFTAKDFRTWHASVWAMELVLHCPAPGRQDALTATEMVRQVARRLGNTCAICRKYYIHPEVLKLCEAPERSCIAAQQRAGLSPAECALLALLSR